MNEPIASTAPITMTDIAAVSNGRIIEHLTRAALGIRGMGPGAAQACASIYFEENMTEAERLAFPFFLVRMRDELATLAESRSRLFARAACRLARVALNAAA